MWWFFFSDVFYNLIFLHYTRSNVTQKLFCLEENFDKSRNTPTLSGKNVKCSSVYHFSRHYIILLCRIKKKNILVKYSWQTVAWSISFNQYKKNVQLHNWESKQSFTYIYEKINNRNSNKVKIWIELVVDSYLQIDRSNRTLMVTFLVVHYY